MKQHPVPQNIASYQFRLVGEMTLKQFLELAGGAILAYFTFLSKLPYFIKWPFVFSFAFSGFAFAFLPIEERPLDQWAVNFLKAIFSNTTYIWKKNNPPPSYFFYSQDHKQPKRDKQAQKNKQKLEEYLQSFSHQQQKMSPFDQKEEQRLEKINKLLQTTQFPRQQPKQQSQKETAPDTKEEQKEGAKPKLKPARPLTPPMMVESSKKIKQKIKPEVVAMFSDQLAIPSPPDQPNVLVGAVLDTNERILPNTIIEISNQKGETIRALKSNKLGQFFVATPLEKGTYKIELEHDDFVFDIIKLEAKDQIIPPLKIKAKSKKK